MIPTLVLVLTAIAATHADCGHCPVENMTKPEDLLQAQAYNAMPKDWKAVPLRSLNVQGYAKVEIGYGPWACIEPCAKGPKGDAECLFSAIRKTEDGLYKHTELHSKCTQTYHDDKNQKCIEPPQWDVSKTEMVCTTHKVRQTRTWGYTHYPICVSTKKMCGFPQIQTINHKRVSKP